MFSETLSGERSVRQLVGVVKNFSAQMGFDEHQCGMIGIAVSEIAMNALRHARNGRALVGYTENHKGIEVRVEDSGPGIDDLARAFEDGYSTYGSFGLGLGAAKRSVDRLIVNSHDARGTSITLRHYLPVPPEDIDAAAVSRSMFPDEPNGDAVVIKPYEGECLLAAIIDGSGKGAKAALTANDLADLVAAEYFLPLARILKNCHLKVRDGGYRRYAEMCLLRITPGYIEYASVGDCRAYSSCSGISFAPQNGTIGLKIPKHIVVQKFARPALLCATLMSDGISSKAERREPNQSTAYQNAKYIFDRHCTGEDDATVIFIKAQS